MRQLELVHAEPFRTERPFRHVWRQEQPLVDRGWLLVLAGDPAQMVPRQTKEPVLFVGAQTADRVNTGQDSGRIVAIVPGEFRLEDAPIFYGQGNLPEELQQLEPELESLLMRRLARGRITVAVRWVETTARSVASINTNALQAYVEQLQNALPKGIGSELRMADLLALPGVARTLWICSMRAINPAKVSGHGAQYSA